MKIDKKSNIMGFKLEMISSAMLYIVVGVLLVLFPGTVVKTFCYGIASIVMAVGIAKLAIYFVKKNKEEDPGKFGFLPGTFFIVLSVLIIILAKAIISAIPFVLGILIAVSGFTKLSGAMKVKKVNDTFDAKRTYIVAIVNIVVGLLLALNPYRAAKIALVILGICLIFTGISDIASSVYFSKRIKEHMQDMEVLDQEYKEIK